MPEVRSELLVEVDFYGADVGGADGDHGEEAVAPAAEEGDAFVQHKQVFEPFGDVGAHAEQFACVIAINHPESAISKSRQEV